MIKYGFRFSGNSIATGVWNIPLDIPEANKPEYLCFGPGKPKSEVKCTCGVKFTGGICSDWCDTNHPVEDTEEFPF